MAKTKPPKFRVSNFESYYGRSASTETKPVDVANLLKERLTAERIVLSRAAVVIMAAIKESAILHKRLNYKTRRMCYEHKRVIFPQPYACKHGYADYMPVYQVITQLRDVVYAMLSNHSRTITFAHWELLHFIIQRLYDYRAFALIEYNTNNDYSNELRLIKEMLAEVKYSTKIPYPAYSFKAYRRGWELFAILHLPARAYLTDSYTHKSFNSRACRFTEWAECRKWHKEQALRPVIQFATEAVNNAVSTSDPAITQNEVEPSSSATTPAVKVAPKRKTVNATAANPVVDTPTVMLEVSKDKSVQVVIPVAILLECSVADDKLKIEYSSCKVVEPTTPVRLKDSESTASVLLTQLVNVDADCTITFKQSTLKSRVQRYNTAEQKSREEQKKKKCLDEIQSATSSLSPEAKAYLEMLLKQKS